MKSASHSTEVHEELRTLFQKHAFASETEITGSPEMTGPYGVLEQLNPLVTAPQDIGHLERSMIPSHLKVILKVILKVVLKVITPGSF